jgi:hypothetical protein
MVPNLPEGLPSIGKTIYAKYFLPFNKALADREMRCKFLGAAGHEPTTFQFNVDGSLKCATNQKSERNKNIAWQKVNPIGIIGHKAIKLAVAQKCLGLILDTICHPGRILTDVEVSTSRVFISEMIDSLSKLERQNKTIYSEMETLFERVTEQMRWSFSWCLDESDFEEIIYSHHLQPDYHLSQTELNYVAHRAHLQAEALERLVNKVSERAETEQQFDENFLFK